MVTLLGLRAPRRWGEGFVLFTQMYWEEVKMFGVKGGVLGKRSERGGKGCCGLRTSAHLSVS